jgi:hypothetical protein
MRRILLLVTVLGIVADHSTAMGTEWKFRAKRTAAACAGIG